MTREKSRTGSDAVKHLCRVVYMLRCTTLEVFDECGVDEIIAVCTTLMESGWDLYPDQLTAEEFQMARFGHAQLLNEALEKRLGID